MSKALVDMLREIFPGPAGRVLTDAVEQAHRAGSQDRSLALILGAVGALITGTTLLGQIERAMNRLYGIERDRPTSRKYGRAFLLTITAGTTRPIRLPFDSVPDADTLAHAGVANAEIVISTVPDTLLKGTTNEKLVRQIRMVNPSAKIIATADVLAETGNLYAAGADYVTIARLAEADELLKVVTAAEAGLLNDLKANQEARLRDRQEILP